MSEEKPSEQLARTHIECVYGPTRRVQDTGATAPICDYRGDNCSFEVKEIVAAAFREIRSQLQGQSFFCCADLTRHWSISIEVPTSAERFRPIPEFPDDPDITDFQVLGYRVATKKERIAEFEVVRDAEPPPFPGLRKLTKDVAPLLKTLEKRGITETRSKPFDSSAELSRALYSFEAMTRGSIGISHEQSVDLPAGIQYHSNFGQVRTSRPETLVTRIQGWLDSPDSTNLCASLANEVGRKVGVLVFDQHNEPEFQSALESPDKFTPSTNLDLPEPLDEILAVLGPVAYRYSEQDRWALASDLR